MGVFSAEQDQAVEDQQLHDHVVAPPGVIADDNNEDDGVDNDNDNVDNASVPEITDDHLFQLSSNNAKYEISMVEEELKFYDE